MIGETISHYKIIEKLGEGGMGVVYKAEDTKLGRTVALKFLPPEMTGDAEAKMRFIQEAQAASALDHPNICTIFEIDEADVSQTFIAMAYYEGETLRERIDRGPLKLTEAIETAEQIADGLSRAHESGIVHRDMKPANIMVTSRDEVRILDFGLSKLAGKTKLTREGTTLGTVDYMSPEQARGEDVDHRSDIWSLGAVLYAMLTGRTPFRGEYEQAVIYAILNEHPEPVTAVRSGVPMALERIVDRCLSKDPGERYQTAGDLAADLRRLKRALSEKSSLQPVSASRLAGTRWVPWVCALAVIVVLAVIFMPRYLSKLEAPSGERRLDDRKMLVVLPFENLGAPEDEYFAEGMTEEITSRLAAVSGLGVISRTSAIQYDRSGKTLKQVGSDLGVDYVLEGTIRWDKQTDDGNRVRVTPQLIRVSDDTHLWAETYDRVLEDIFAVQSDIAGRIIEQLGISMLAREREAVEAKPTENLLAYEAYLRGRAHMGRAGSQEDRWRSAETLLRQAVELDPTFALAFAHLADVHGELYFWGFDKTDERLAMAKAAVDRSLELQPDLPEAHLALGAYYYMGFFDYDRALKEYAIAAKDLPNNSLLFEGIAYIWRRQGLFQEAIGYLEKAATLDPTNFWLYMQIGLTYSYLRQYEEAERYFDRSLVLEPQQHAFYFNKSLLVVLWKGDIKEARAILESAPALLPQRSMESFFDLHMLERDYQGALDCLSDMPGGYFDFATSISPRELLAGIAYEYLGNTERARAAYDSARVLMENVVRERPEDGAAHGTLGRVYACLGQKEEAILMGKKGLELDADDELLSTERETDLAWIYTEVGMHDAALDIIEHLLSVPSLISVPLLEIDPIADPLRDHPRFKQILRKYSGEAK